MLIRGNRRRSWLNGRLVLLVACFFFCVLICGASFVAGAEAFRQGRFHDLREYAQAALKPTVRVRAWIDAPEPAVVAIDLKFKHLRRIQQKREEALITGTIQPSDSDYVPARLRAGDRSLDVKVRLKGHALDHLQGRKWSLRVKIGNGETLWGMRGFALQHPKTRGFEREWFFHRHLQAEGLLGQHCADAQLR